MCPQGRSSQPRGSYRCVLRKAFEDPAKLGQDGRWPEAPRHLFAVGSDLSHFIGQVSCPKGPGREVARLEEASAGLQGSGRLADLGYCPGEEEDEQKANNKDRGRLSLNQIQHQDP